jgi:hypothetical protein
MRDLWRRNRKNERGAGKKRKRYEARSRQQNESPFNCLDTPRARVKLQKSGPLPDFAGWPIVIIGSFTLRGALGILT